MLAAGQRGRLSNRRAATEATTLPFCVVFESRASCDSRFATTEQELLYLQTSGEVRPKMRQKLFGLFRSILSNSEATSVPGLIAPQGSLTQGFDFVQLLASVVANKQRSQSLNFGVRQDMLCVNFFEVSVGLFIFSLWSFPVFGRCRCASFHFAFASAGVRCFFASRGNVLLSLGNYRFIRSFFFVSLAVDCCGKGRQQAVYQCKSNKVRLLRLIRLSVCPSVSQCKGL